jgi:uncharacterized protein (TIGR00730 family)
MQTKTEQSEFISSVAGEYEKGFEVSSRVTKKKVTIYGSARVEDDSNYFKMVEELSYALHVVGVATISGGGPGIMKAALGEDKYHHDTVAYRIDINKEVASPTEADFAVDFKHFSVRKHFLRMTDAVVVAPGGFGTLDEVFEVLTLIQTKKIKKIPVIFYGKSFYKPLLDWFEEKLEVYGMINDSETHLYKLVDSPQEVLEELSTHGII